MFTIDHGVVAFIALLGFALLALGAHWAASRQFIRGLVTVGAGAGLLVVLTTRLYPALLSTAWVVERDQLRQTLVRERGLAASYQAERDRAVERLETAAADRLRLERSNAQAMARIALEVNETTTHYRQSDGAVRLPSGPMNSAPRESVDGIIADVRALRMATVAAPVVVETQRPEVPVVIVASTPVMPSQSPVQAPSAGNEVTVLRDRLSTRLDTRAYVIEPLPDVELVTGLKGRYYTVDVKNAESGVTYVFESGRYTLPQGSAEFRRSVNAFMSDVVAKIDGKRPFQLYVRGSADRLSYIGRFEPGYEFREISYLANLGGARYAAEPSVMWIDGVVRNRELPNLRAAFLQSVVGEAFPKKPPQILEGIVAPRREAASRNAELILFVDW